MTNATPQGPDSPDGPPVSATGAVSTVESGNRSWRLADLTVLVLVVVALVGGGLLRQSQVDATQDATFEGLHFVVPKGTIVKPGDGYSATTVDGLSFQVEKVKTPPIGSDVDALISARVLQRGRDLQLFQSTGTEQTQVGGKTAGAVEYQYVKSNAEQVFTQGLTVIEGRELLIPDGDNFYALAVEGPATKAAALAKWWSTVQDSVRLGGE